MSKLLAPLEREHVKELIRCLKSSVFQAPAQLLEALAHTDAATRHAAGLLTTSSTSLVPVMGSIIGQPAGGGSVGGASGVVGLLGSKDWMVRRAAADALKCLAVVLGPRMEPDNVWGASPQSLTARWVRGAIFLPFSLPFFVSFNC